MNEAKTLDYVSKVTETQQETLGKVAVVSALLLADRPDGFTRQQGEAAFLTHGPTFYNC